MTTHIDYLQDTEERLKDWGKYYRAVRLVNLGYPTSVMSHSIIVGRVFEDPAIQVPARIQDIESNIVLMPKKISYPLVCRYYFQNRDAEGAKYCHTNPKSFRDRIREGLNWIHARLYVKQ